jgi:hypothetical protein
MKKITILVELPTTITIASMGDLFSIITQFSYFKPHSMFVRIESNDINREIKIIIYHNPFNSNFTFQKLSTHFMYLRDNIFLLKQIKNIDTNIGIIIKRDDDYNRNPEYVMNKIEKYYNLPKGSLNINTNRREIVEKRQIAHFISKQAGYSLSKIGEIIGHRDHATVLHSC